MEVSTEEEIVHRKVAVALRRDGIRSRGSLLAAFDNARPTACGEPVEPSGRATIVPSFN